MAWWHIGCPSDILQACLVLLPSGWQGWALGTGLLLSAASGHEAEASGMTSWAQLGTQPCGQCPETIWVVQRRGRKYSRGQA